MTNWTSKKGVMQQTPDRFLPSDLLIVPPVGQSSGNLEGKGAQSRKEEGEGANRISIRHIMQWLQIVN